MSSASLPPIRDSDGRYFLRTQTWTKPSAPPPSTSVAGQTAIITGSNTGIGLECARVLLGLSLSHLILAVRNADKGNAAARGLQEAHPRAKVEVWQLDMASYESIQSFASRCDTLQRLNIVILNAAIFNVDFAINPSTGHEEMFQVNYLSTALLAILLLPALKSNGPSYSPGRLTLVSSTLGLRSQFRNHGEVPLIPSFDNPKEFDGGATNNQYSLSKTLVLVIMVMLSKITSAEDVVINAVGPALTGGISELDRNVSRGAKVFVRLLKAVAAHTPQEAAWLYVDGSIVKGKESHGNFIINGEYYPFHEIMYTSEGEAAMSQLWNETVAELKFANVEGILAQMQRGL